jgi:hypothetical protein
MESSRQMLLRQFSPLNWLQESNRWLEVGGIRKANKVAREGRHQLMEPNKSGCESVFYKEKGKRKKVVLL